ncbi:hypothetical protein HRbin34_00064 [bacterium HR34]|nr:hypothetical protein HRbin34_00064 [bacterium HR34]
MQLKKLLATISLLSLVLGLVVVIPDYAQSQQPLGPQAGCTLRTDVKWENSTINKGTPANEGNYGQAWSTICLIDTIQFAIRWLFLIIVIIAVILIVIASLLWLTAAGNEEQTKRARGLITAAAVGIAIAAIAYMVPSIVRYILGV